MRGGLPGADGIEPQWARVAVVEMHADAAPATVILALSPSASGVAAKARGQIAWSDISLDVVAVGEGIPGDFDGDVDVDLDDFGLFQACLTGPNLGPPSPECEDTDLDTDGDVDQSDFGFFQRCLSEPGVLAEPAPAASGQ